MVLAHFLGVGMEDEDEIEENTKKQQRAELELQVSQFLANGGKITLVPQGVSGMPEVGGQALSIKQQAVRKQITLEQLLMAKTPEVFMEICLKSGVEQATIIGWRTNNEPLRQHTIKLGLVTRLGKFIIKR